MAKPPKEFIIVRETWRESLINDAGTCVLFIALIGIGVALESEAMQWVGACMGFVTIVGKSLAKRHIMSLAQARKRLDEIETEIAAE